MEIRPIGPLMTMLMSNQNLQEDTKNLAIQMQGLAPGSPQYLYDQLHLELEKEQQKIRDEHFRCVKAKTSKRKMNNVAIRQKNCPEFKEVNPLTKRCIKKCKEPRFRDDCFRCVKTRSVNKNITKICKDNKEVNPFTGRCVKKCKEPRIRNNCFRCTTKKIYKHN